MPAQIVHPLHRQLHLVVQCRSRPATSSCNVRETYCYRNNGHLEHLADFLRCGQVSLPALLSVQSNYHASKARAPAALNASRTDSRTEVPAEMTSSMISTLPLPAVHPPVTTAFAVVLRLFAVVGRTARCAPFRASSQWRCRRPARCPCRPGQTTCRRLKAGGTNAAAVRRIRVRLAHAARRHCKQPGIEEIRRQGGRPWS